MNMEMQLHVDKLTNEAHKSESTDVTQESELIQNRLCVMLDEANVNNSDGSTITKVQEECSTDGRITATSTDTEIGMSTQTMPAVPVENEHEIDVPSVPIITSPTSDKANVGSHDNRDDLATEDCADNRSGDDGSTTSLIQDGSESDSCAIIEISDGNNEGYGGLKRPRGGDNSTNDVDNSSWRPVSVARADEDAIVISDSSGEGEISKPVLKRRRAPRVPRKLRPIVPKLPINGPITPAVPSENVDVGCECCIVEILMKRQFTQKYWTDNERVNIVRKGPPQPLITPSIEIFTYVTQLHYEQYPWLTGCLRVRYFCCWPCLLFSCSADIWHFDFHALAKFHATGSSLMEEVSKHGSASYHKESEMLLKQWTTRIYQADSDASKKPKANAPPRDLVSNEKRTHDLGGVDGDYINKLECLVMSLLRNNFIYGTWTDQERQRIILSGRPTPKLEGMATDQDGPLSCNNRFNESQYKKVWWLTGSAALRRLFCWPCVLFSTMGPWVKTGYCEFNNLPLALVRHETSQQHYEASLRLKIWEKQIKQKLRVRNITPDEHYEAVMQNREFFKFLISIVCYTKTKFTDPSLFYGYIVAVIKGVSSHQLKLRQCLRKKCIASENDVLEILASIEICMKSRIIEEQKKSHFISLILSAVNDGPWLSVSVRYAMDNGDVHERFIKFVKFDHDQPPEVLIEEIQPITMLFECEQRLVGFTYDGLILKPTDVSSFNSAMQAKFPLSQFFHHKDHNLKVVLQQTLSHVKCCKNFVHSINELSNFFERFPKAKNSLNCLINTDGNDTTLVKLNNSDFTIDLITTIKRWYPLLIILFERVVYAFDKDSAPWDNESAWQAKFFLDFLQDVRNWFLVVLISKVYKVIDILTEALKQTFVLDVWLSIVSSTKQCLEDVKVKGFQDNFESAWTSMGVHNLRPQHVHSFREHFDDVLDVTLNFIESRTQNLHSWGCFETLTDHNVNHNVSSIMHQWLPRLQYKFSASEVERLLPQMIFLGRVPLFQSLSGQALIKRLYELDMMGSLSALHKFVQLVLTVPIGSKNLTSTSAVERTSAYTKNRKVISSIHALMCIEKDLLAEMQQENNFYESVLDCFAEASNRKDLHCEKP